MNTTTPPDVADLFARIRDHMNRSPEMADAMTDDYVRVNWNGEWIADYAQDEYAQAGLNADSTLWVFVWDTDGGGTPYNENATRTDRAPKCYACGRPGDLTGTGGFTGWCQDCIDNEAGLDAVR